MITFTYNTRTLKLQGSDGYEKICTQLSPEWYIYTHIKQHILQQLNTMLSSRLNVFEHINYPQKIKDCQIIEFDIIKLDYVKTDDQFFDILDKIMTKIRAYIYPSKSSPYFANFNARFNDLQATINYYSDKKKRPYETLPKKSINAPQLMLDI